MGVARPQPAPRWQPDRGTAGARRAQPCNACTTDGDAALKQAALPGGCGLPVRNRRGCSRRTTQMACEEVEQARVVLAAMLVGVEPVPFAGDVQGFHRFAGVAQRTLHLLAVRNRRSAVLAT